MCDHLLAYAVLRDGIFPATLIIRTMGFLIGPEDKLVESRPFQGRGVGSNPIRTTKISRGRSTIGLIADNRLVSKFPPI